MTIFHIFLAFGLFELSVFAKSNWQCSASVDKMENFRMTSCSTTDQSGYTNIRGKPYLIVRDGKEFDVFISAKEYIGNVEIVDVKFDNGPIQGYYVSTSTDKTAMFFNYDYEFIQNIITAKRLLVRYTPYNEDPVTLEFTLSGMSNKNIKSKINQYL